MSYSTANIGNTYSYDKVIMTPIMDDQAGVLDNSLEPQYVRVRRQNASFAFVNNFGASDRISNNRFLITSPGNLFTKRTKRIALTNYRSLVSIPNINPRNNLITFQTGAGTFSVTIPEGFYNRSQAIAALVAALNTVAIPSGCTFSAPNQFPNSDYYIILTGTAPFKIIGGSFVTVGFAFWGFIKGDARLSPTAPFATTLTLGPLSCNYTRYYDVVSFSIQEHTKAANTGNRVPGNCLFRIYFDQFEDGRQTSFMQFGQGSDNAVINYDANHSISYIDIQLIDEHNQPLYLPNGDTNASTIQLSFVNEI